MPLLPDDDRLLYRALDLAREVAAFASPNPAVGCVLVRDGQVLGEGAHRYDLRDHAEIAALNDAAGRGHTVGGATAYVTLEPCSHHGRTGPCAGALVAAKIARCVIATVDPNPQVRGSGIAKLRSAGVEVAVADPASPLAQAARRLNDAFAFSIQHGRPFITLKSAISADGKLAPPPSTRKTAAPHWLTGEAARADVQLLRHASDALLTGIGTVLADDPELTDRTGLPRRRPLLRVVLDSALRTPLDSKLVRSAENNVLLIASPQAPPEIQLALEVCGVEIVRLPQTAPETFFRLLFVTVLQSRGLRSVLAEAGSTLNGSLLSSGCVDRLVLYKAPTFLGPDALPFAIGQPGPDTWAEHLSSTAQRPFPNGSDEDLRITGYLHDPWAHVDTDTSPGG